MKILYLITTREGGAWRYVKDLLSRLGKGYEVVIPEVPHLKAKIGLHDILALWEIIKILKKEKPDIVHLNNTKSSILGSIACQICKVSKVIYSTHGGGAFTEDLPVWKKWFYRECERRTAKFKDYFICLSEPCKDSWIKHKIIPRKEIVVINNGIQLISK